MKPFLHLRFTESIITFLVFYSNKISPSYSNTFNEFEIIIAGKIIKLLLTYQQLRASNKITYFGEIN